MYIICSRCQFRVPAHKHICHICGNAELRSVSSAKAEAVDTNSALDHVISNSIQNIKDNFKVLKQRIFTRRPSESNSVSQERPCDYLTAYKASIRHETFVAPSSNSSGNMLPKEIRRKVEILDECSVTRLRLDELVHWFEDYGKEGIIIPSAKDDDSKDHQAQLSDAA
jgi:hypothetical protein